MVLQVRYDGASGDQVAWGGNDDPRSILRIGGIYSVKQVETHGWHTKIELIGHPGKWFNDSSFTYLNT